MNTAGKEEIVLAETASGNPLLNGNPRLLGDFELDGPASLSLDDDAAITRYTRESDVAHAKSDEIAATQLAVDSQIEKR